MPDAANPQAFNRYSYGYNNPIKYIDPTGHCPSYIDDPVECDKFDMKNGVDSEVGDLWDPSSLQYVNENDRLGAEQAFMLFLRDPEYFVALYMDPDAWAASSEVGYLEVFAEYSQLHTIASELVLGYVWDAYGPDAATSVENINFGMQFDWAKQDLESDYNALANAGLILVRRGSSWESTTRLTRQALAAESAGFPHGVSVTTPQSNARLANNPLDVSTASREAFENAGFTVHHTPTRRDPMHHTVELPKPVTPNVARRFNEVLGRRRR